MKKVVRRLFPSRPVLGVTLLVLISIEASAIAQTVIGRGTTQEGTWSYPGSTPIAGQCTYYRSDDVPTVTGVGEYIFKYVNWHHSFCTPPASVANGVSYCPQAPPVSSSCDEDTDRNHYTNRS